jgi:hypothetical protein
MRRRIAAIHRLNRRQRFEACCAKSATDLSNPAHAEPVEGPSFVGYITVTTGCFDKLSMSGCLSAQSAKIQTASTA